MKKLALIVVIAVLCMLPVIASAADIEGKYKMIASGSCIHSQNGYYDANVVNPVVTLTTAKPGIVYAGTTVLDGVWDFDTLKIDYTIHATVTPPPTVPPPGHHGPPVSIPGGIRKFHFTNIDFTYTINGTNIQVNSEGLVLSGAISSDGNIITLLSADTVQDFGSAPYWFTICNTARTLIKVDD